MADVRPSFRAVKTIKIVDGGYIGGVCKIVDRRTLTNEEAIALVNTLVDIDGRAFSVISVHAAPEDGPNMIGLMVVPAQEAKQ